MNDELNFNGNEIVIDEFNLGITPEDVLKKSYNGEAPRRSFDTIDWKTDAEIYDPEELESFEIAEGDISLQIGDSRKLSIITTPSMANTPNVVWETSDYSVATVDSTGLVITYSEGSVVITAGKPETDLSASVTITVTAGEDTEEDTEEEDNQEEPVNPSPEPEPEPEVPEPENSDDTTTTQPEDEPKDGE